MGGMVPLGDASRRPARVPVVTALIIGRRELLDHVIAISESHLKRLRSLLLSSTTIRIAPIAGFRSRLRKREGAAQAKESDRVASCRWSSPSLRTRRLNLAPFYFLPGRSAHLRARHLLLPAMQSRPWFVWVSLRSLW
jgi:hypothetical protein